MATVALVAAGVGGYWHYSPYLSMHAMRQAAQRQDADAFNEKVDYPRLRESLKGQMSAMMTEKMAGSGGNGFEALGAMLGMALLNPMIDAFVRPEVVMKAMQKGEFDPAGKGAAATESDSKKPVQWDFERPSLHKIIAYPKEQGHSEGSRVGFVFERSGFADWKLTEIRLPRL